MDTCARIRRVCVFCGARSGVNPLYSDMARELGTLLANKGIGLVYGGGSVGLMGAVANAALQAGGEVTGVIPRALAGRELSHAGLTRLDIVDSMHARKALMEKYADAFIALPGGFGTMDELFEIVTWAFLGIHDKPIGLLNADGYFQPLIALLEHMVRQDFACEAQRDAVVLRSTPGEVLHALLQASARRVRISAPVAQSVVQ